MTKKDRLWRKIETNSVVANKPDAVQSSIDENFQLLEQYFKSGSSLVTGKIVVMDGLFNVGIAYIGGLVNVSEINEHIIAQLQNGNPDSLKNKPKNEWFQIIRTHFIANIDTKEINDINELNNYIIQGSTILFIDSVTSALAIGTRKIDKRNIDTPDAEVALHGSKDSFVEDIETNCSLLRRRLATPRLQFTELVLGKISRTKVRVCWVEEIAKPEIVAEVSKRLAQIDVDAINSLGMITEFIEDSPFSIFPQYRKTQRCDRACADLTEGRVAILTDGFPFVLLVPLVILQELQTVDDYAEKPILGTLLRQVRYFAIFISIMLSPLYLSFVAYNHTIIPASLAKRIAAGREGVPFPSFLEVLLLTSTIDVLREAGLRLSPNLGGAISVLGAVVIGQAAVTAGYFSASVIIVIAITAISTFAIPSSALGSTARVLNYLLIILAGISGIFGVVLGVILIIWRLTDLRSFGVTLIYPLETGKPNRVKDLLIRAPFWNLRKRPEVITTDNDTRVSLTTQKPSPPKE